MAFSINKATLVGNISSDLILKQTTSGDSVINFSVATNRSIKNDDGSYKDLPTFHRIVVWGKLAEWIARDLTKGSKVFIEGRIDNRSYETEKGEKKYISEIVAYHVIGLGGRKIKQGEVQEEKNDEVQREEVELDLDDTAKDIPKGDEKVGVDDIPF